MWLSWWGKSSCDVLNGLGFDLEWIWLLVAICNAWMKPESVSKTSTRNNELQKNYAAFCILVISFFQWTTQRWCWRWLSSSWCWVSVSVGNYTMKLLSDQNDHSWFSCASRQQESSRRPCATHIASSWWKSWRPGWKRSRTAERNTWIWLRFRATQTERS